MPRRCSWLTIADLFAIERDKDNSKMVNGTELQLRMRFKNLGLVQASSLPQRSVGSRACPAAPTCAANGLQPPSPLVRRHALMRRVHRQASGLLALSLIGSTAQPQHAGIKRLTSVFPRSSSSKYRTDPQNGHCLVGT